MLQNGQTELTKPIPRLCQVPEGVRGYVERRSLFVAKRLKNRKIEHIEIFHPI